MWPKIIATILSNSDSILSKMIDTHFINLSAIIDLEGQDIQQAVLCRVISPSIIWDLEVRSRYWYVINIAILYGRIDSIKTLLRLDSRIVKHADIALAIALESNRKNSIDIIQLLLEAGADPNGAERNILHILYSQAGLRMRAGNTIRKMVLKYGADPNIENLSGHKPHDNLWPHDRAEAKCIVELVQSGATYTKETIGQLLECESGLEILVNLDCSIIQTQDIRERVRSIMSGYHRAKCLNWMTQLPERSIWEKSQLLKLKEILQFRINKMHSGRVPSATKILEYRLQHIPRFMRAIHYLASWIKVYERRIDGDENVVMRDIIKSIKLQHGRVKSLKFMCLQQVTCNKLFGPILLS